MITTDKQLWEEQVWPPRRPPSHPQYRREQFLQIHHNIVLSYHLKHVPLSVTPHLSLADISKLNVPTGNFQQWKNSAEKLTTVLLWPKLEVGDGHSRESIQDITWSGPLLSKFKMFLTEDLALYRLLPKELVTTKTPKPWKLFVSAKFKAQLYTQPKNQAAFILHFWLILPGHILKPSGLNY